MEEMFYVLNIIVEHYCGNVLNIIVEHYSKNVSRMPKAILKCFIRI